MRHGFIGLGHLGGHLATSLVRQGFPLTVHDRNRGAAESLIAKGAAWAETPRVLAAGCDVVITCLPSPAVSEAVLTGPDGILAGLKRGGTWIEMSTLGRDEVQRLAKLAEAQGISVLESPVTGGVHRAAEGEITVLVGGDKALFE